MERDDCTPKSLVGSKGKEHDTLNRSSNTEGDDSMSPDAIEKKQDKDGSTISRLTNSAMALGSSILSKPEAGGRIMSSGKAGNASVSAVGPGPSLGEASAYRLQANMSSQGSLRPAHTQDLVAREEAAFSQFLEGMDISDPSAHSDIGSIVAGLPGNDSQTTSRVFQSAHTSGYTDTDGLEVVNLLDSGYDEVAQPAPDMPLTSQEQAFLRQALFENSSHGGDIADWADLLNFVPEYISNSSSGWGYGELLQHLGTSDIMEASKIWASQWGDVLSRYTDEVWGDLGPLVQEAREEARKIQDSGREVTPSESKAILRLGQLLAHIRIG